MHGKDKELRLLVRLQVQTHSLLFIPMTGPYITDKDLMVHKLFKTVGINDRKKNKKHYSITEPMEKKTLKQLFESQQDALAQNLAGLFLPKDAKKVQEIIATHMAGLFDRNGEFRQNLTQSEDYILQAALSLLNAQQSMIGELSKTNIETDSRLAEMNIQGNRYDRIQPYLAIGGSTVGALTADAILICTEGASKAAIFGTWGAVFGAIAGTAIAIYFSYRRQTKPSSDLKKSDKSISAHMKGIPLDTTAFLSIVGNICDSIDNLISTYQVQIKRLKNSYEAKEKPTLLNDYSSLINQIENVCRTAESTDNGHAKLLNAINMMAEVLENYDLKYENGKICSI